MSTSISIVLSVWLAWRQTTVTDMDQKRVLPDRCTRVWREKRRWYIYSSNPPTPSKEKRVHGKRWAWPCSKLYILYTPMHFHMHFDMELLQRDSGTEQNRVGPMAPWNLSPPQTIYNMKTSRIIAVDTSLGTRFLLSASLDSTVSDLRGLFSYVLDPYPNLTLKKNKACDTVAF